MYTNAYRTEQIGRFVKEARKEKGMTQEQMSAHLGVSHATLSKLEAGGSVSLDTAVRALQWLGMRIVIVPKRSKVKVEKGDGET